MLNIVCFGDSNTWGYDSDSETMRFSKDVRWTGILKRMLGSNYNIIEEGLNGRTILFDSKLDMYENGYSGIEEILNRYENISILVIMLGTNDTKNEYNRSSKEIGNDMDKLIEKVRKSYINDIIIIAPPSLSNNQLGFSFNDESREKVKQLGNYYKMVANKYQCHFLDLSEDIITAGSDGIHLDKQNHLDVATHIFNAIHNI